MRIDKDDIEEVVEEISEAFQDADQYLAIAKGIIEIGKPVAVDVLKVVVKTLTDIRCGLEPELAAQSLASAKATHRDFMNYKEAGFTEEQAFTLVLAAIKPVNFSEMLTKGVTDGVRSRMTDKK